MCVLIVNVYQMEIDFKKKKKGDSVLIKRVKAKKIFFLMLIRQRVIGLGLIEADSRFPELFKFEWFDFILLLH